MNTAIKRISDIDHIKTIYSEHMRKDFPVNELMPFPAIQKMLDSHMYECYGLYCDDKFAGYAFFLRQEIAGCSNYLLDYFAMILDCGDQGYGSLFLGQLKEMLSDADCILVEADDPDKAKNDAARKIRMRRIDFYRRNGYITTKHTMQIFGADYRLLVLPITDTFDIDRTRQIYEMIYKTRMPEHIFRLFFKWTG